ncbi:LamG domain-containing protein [Haliangium sp.]|uniref:LamG domain-containing protein n=1 Tax=Haliangium sp. TaxID=2663208 RepID=UPI003D1283AA
MLVGCGEIREVTPDATPPPPPPIDAAPGCERMLIDGVAGCGFANGEFSGIRAATGGGITLGDGRESGEFVSRVFDSGDAGAMWSTLAWTIDGPHGVPLPDGGERELGFLLDGANMTDNVLLLHLDDAATGPGRLLADGSGRANHPVIASTASDPLATLEGRFGQAIADTLDSHFYLDVDPTQTPPVGGDFDVGEGDFTWALWVRSSQDCTDENRVYMGIEGQGQDGLIHLWLGCRAGGGAECAAGSPAGRAGGFFTTSQGTGPNGAGFCGLRQINDDAWHHLALVKSAHAPARLSLYVDGELESEVEADFHQPIVFTEPTEFTFGAFARDLVKYQAEASFDEIAIWRRALSAGEVAALYRRGALRVGFQVRACADPACADDPAFVGPGGSETRLYRASSEGVGPERSVALDSVSGRYLQYRVVLDSDVAGESPILRRVALSLDP